MEPVPLVSTGCHSGNMTHMTDKPLERLLLLFVVVLSFSGGPCFLRSCLLGLLLTKCSILNADQRKGRAVPRALRHNGRLRKRLTRKYAISTRNNGRECTNQETLCQIIVGRKSNDCHILKQFRRVAVFVVCSNITGTFPAVVRVTWLSDYPSDIRHAAHAGELGTTTPTCQQMHATQHQKGNMSAEIRSWNT